MAKCKCCIYCRKSVYSIKDYCFIALAIINIENEALDCSKHTVASAIRIQA